MIRIYHIPLSMLIVLMTFTISCQRDTIDFNAQVKPILHDKCISCHGGVKKQGGLSLLSRADATATNPKSGLAAIIPGNAKSSEFYKRIIADDVEYSMPREGHKLNDEETEIIRTWINEGAKWDSHWAYTKVLAPAVPAIESSWAESNIDKFVLDNLSQFDLEPNAADQNDDLLRRVSLDLIGLPPPNKLYHKQMTSNPLGYEQLVDSLLESPSFGEHWASMWLDLARYADSKGYEKDPHRNIYRYRDWLIHALNKDMPFDEFSKAQIAGDLISPDEPEMLIATSFHRNAMTNTEGGTDDEEFRVAAVIDRLNTTFEVWQALPIGCAQCHDHPYEPISQKEYYESLAYFNNTVDADLTSEYPVIEHYDEKDEKSINELIDFITRKEQKEIPASSLITDRIKATLYPTLLARDSDDLENSILFPAGNICNWTNNVQDMEGRRFYFMYDDIPFDGLDSIKVRYATVDTIARLELRLDSKDGQVLFNTNFDSTYSASAHEWSGRHDWRWHSEAIATDIEGEHDMVFELINKNSVVPNGILHIDRIQLVYDNKSQDEMILSLKDSLIALRSKAERTPIILEKSDALSRTHQLFVRGNHLNRVDSLQAAIPEILNHNDSDGQDRLALANWLVHKDNPLTARVMVNRIWHSIFGNGLVTTMENFGSNGEAPTNRALLDYLAYQFVHVHEWSIKSMLKEIVMSNTYKQSSHASQAKLEVDPYNLYLSRGPRFRLRAEQIRDQALYLSGMLYDTIGGPSVMPYQPDNVWQTVYNNSQWQTSKNKHQYRKGLYTYWKRSSPYPSMEAFDSPSREFCKSERISTNTPNQALVTLNDPVYIEAANAMATIMQNHSEDPSERIKYVLQRSLAKQADEDMLARLATLYAQADQQLGEEGDKQFGLASPEAVVAHAVFNLDAFLNKS